MTNPVETFEQKVTKFLSEKEPKYQQILSSLLKVSDISLSKDIALLTSLLEVARKNLNVTIHLYRNVELLQSKVRGMLCDLNFFMTEEKIKCLSDEEWCRKNITAKMSKEERDMKAASYNSDLNRSIYLMTKFEIDVDSLKRAVAVKKEDLEHVRKDLVAMIWGIRTEEFLNGRIKGHNPEEVNKFLSTGYKDVDGYLKT